MNSTKIIIIAEAGVNHNGCINTAKTMVEVAAAAKANFVKFQTFNTVELVQSNTSQAPYQKLNSDSASQFEMLKSLELSEEEFIELKVLADKLGIGFLSTAFDEKSIDLVHSLNDKIGKIPSGQITDYPYLVKIAKLFPQLILSTGMSTEEEIKQCLDLLFIHGHSIDTVTLLHCTSAYPTPDKEVQIKTMKFLSDKFKCPVGFSDHSKGNIAAILSVALGSTIIEKHFTLDKNQVGPDHKASLNPDELENYIKDIRTSEQMLGNGKTKIVSKSERMNIKYARKSLYSKTDIKKGDLLNRNNLTTKRPAIGLSPMSWTDIENTVAFRDFKRDELIELE